MFGLPLGLILRIGAGLALAAALAWGYHLVAEHFREQGREELRPEITALRASIATTQERATALALLWSHQVDKTEDVARRQEKDRAQTFASLQKEAAAVPHGHLGGISVLDRARSAAVGTSAGPTSEPDKSTPTDSASPEEFVVSLYAWIGECKARVDEWSSFYRGLQQASP